MGIASLLPIPLGASIAAEASLSFFKKKSLKSIHIQEILLPLL